MSLSSAMAAAVSGLAASARAVQTVSANVSNAMTEGYAPRQIVLSAATLGGAGNGVKVVGVERQTDPVLSALMRQSGGAAAQHGTLAGFWTTLEQAIGLPGDPHGLGGKVAAVEVALISAGARPDLDHRLAAVADAASDLAGHLNRLEAQVQTLRFNADAGIARDVEALNQGLEQIARLNRDITKFQATGQPAHGLMDERQALIDSLSAILPIREYPHADGRIALYSEGGLLLLDTRPAVFEFHASPGVEAGMSLGGGTLSGLRVNGIAAATGPAGPLAGGRLAANFVIRDDDAPRAQAALDQIAESLIRRFEDPLVDPSAAPGQAGIFSDGGLALDPGATTGLAGRLALSALVDPDRGGALWRLRDGLGAAAPGPVGAAEQIGRWIEALQKPLPGAPGTAARGFADTVGQAISGISQARQAAEDRLGHASAYRGELQHVALSRGVDVDAEMQRLLVIEKAYAANAKVVEVADSLLRRLMEI